MPGYQVSGWNCLVAPRGTPAPVIKRLNAEIVAGFSQPDMVERLRKQSIDPAALLTFTRQHLADFKVPQFVTIRNEPLPRNAGGKVLKPVLRAETKWD